MAGLTPLSATSCGVADRRADFAIAKSGFKEAAMKAFLVGLIFLFAVVILTGISILLLPLIMVLALFLRVFIGFAFVMFCIWALGKLIIFIWGKIDKKT